MARLRIAPTNGEYQLRHRSEHYQGKESVSVGIGQADISNPMSQGIFLRPPSKKGGREDWYENGRPLDTPRVLRP